MGEFDVTAAQYVQFLNAVATTSDPYGLYNSGMQTDGGYTLSGYPIACGIFRSSSSGSYSYRIDDRRYGKRLSFPLLLRTSP